MSSYIYHEKRVVNGDRISIPDHVNPDHITLVDTPDGIFVKWLEPAAEVTVDGL